MDIKAPTTASTCNNQSQRTSTLPLIDGGRLLSNERPDGAGEQHEQGRAPADEERRVDEPPGGVQVEHKHRRRHRPDGAHHDLQRRQQRAVGPDDDYLIHSIFLQIIIYRKINLFL